MTSNEMEDEMDGDISLLLGELSDDLMDEDTENQGNDRTSSNLLIMTPLTFSSKGLPLFYDERDYEYRLRCGKDFEKIYTDIHVPIRCNVRSCQSTGTLLHLQVIESTEHDHLSNEDKQKVRNIRAKMVEEYTAGVPSTVAVKRALNKFVEGDIEQPPSSYALAKECQSHKSRDSSGVYPFQGFEESFTSDHIYAENISSSSVMDPESIVIWTDRRLVEQLAASPNWASDGTFARTPRPFTQLYIIGYQDNRSFIPVVYAVCGSKTLKIYEIIFNFIRKLVGFYYPTTMMMDFETGAASMFRRIFQQSRVQRCGYHFSQIVYRRVKNAGLLSYVNGDIRIKRIVRCLMNLFYLEPTSIPGTFRELYLLACETAPELKKFMTEFCYRYICGAKQQQPQFPPSEWSMCSRMLKGLPACNSPVESYNSQLRKLRSKPTLQQLIEWTSNQDNYNFNMISLAKRTNRQIDEVFPKRRVKRRQMMIKSILQRGKGDLSNLDYLMLIASVAKV